MQFAYNSLITPKHAPPAFYLSLEFRNTISYKTAVSFDILTL